MVNSLSQNTKIKAKIENNLPLKNSFENQNELKIALQNTNYGYDLDNLKQIENNFLKEIGKAQKNSQSSLKYESTQLKSIKNVSENEVFQVLLLGGSHIESALVKVKNGQPKLLSFREEEIGKLQSKQEVFELIEKYLNPKIKYLSLNLAFPLKTTYRKNVIDGILQGSPKEHNLKDLIGQKIGENVENYIKTKFNKKIIVSICNNNVSLAFATKNLKQSQNFDSQNIITGVVATGFNFGFFEDKNSFINLESGSFDKFESSFCGKIIDEESLNPNQNLLEKEVGSAYLWKHFNHLSQKLGLGIKLCSPKEFLDLIQNLNLVQTPEYFVATKLAKKVLENSASLVATKISAIIKFKNQGKNQNLATNKFKIIIEGSLFWETLDYKNLVEKYLELLGNKLENIQFVRIKSSFILGAAKLVINSAKILTLKAKIIQKLISIPKFYIWFSNSPPSLIDKTYKNKLLAFS